MKGPGIGQDVFLLFDTGDPVSGRIDAVLGDTLMLAVPGDLRGPVRELEGDATVHFTNSRGVCRVVGSLCGFDREYERVRFDCTGEVRLIQRRQHVRVDAVIPVSYRAPGGVKVETHTLNISGGGFLVSEPRGLAVGSQTSFVLHLGETDEWQPLEVVGRAVRKTDGGALGISIEGISKLGQERLVRWVFGRERAARQILKQ
ncbi:MAG: hypothetical protein NVSMB25_20410 [Thermoleophilaceae bacterium]